MMLAMVVKTRMQLHRLDRTYLHRPTTAPAHESIAGASLEPVGNGGPEEMMPVMLRLQRVQLEVRQHNRELHHELQQLRHEVRVMSERLHEIESLGRTRTAPQPTQRTVPASLPRRPANSVEELEAAEAAVDDEAVAATLRSASLACLQVHIIGHIPPGQEDCLHVWSDNYNRIIERYESTVRAQFFGHAHKDELELLSEPAREHYRGRRPFSVAYVTPSTTTFNSGHPAYRVYVIDGNYANSAWAVLDHETYLMNPTEANMDPHESLPGNWSTRQQPRLACSPWSAEWDDLLNKMELDDRLFDKFYRFYGRQDPTAQPCNSVSRKSFLCKQRTSKSSDLKACR
ncbi:sphingomyelin phosphodiesterase-like [Dermacentor andersoni]|uniref:sphingomyelin phosphodiesterase-like n=1 Tax=Dermacentor andersoni TaxID=34620 RepID=UPI003B3A5A69